MNRRARGFLPRAWAVAAKDLAEELRLRVAAGAVFFFAATAVALVAFAVGPFGVPEEARHRLHAALLWIVLFFSAATGLPRAFVREEEAGTALALRRLAPATVVVAGKAIFNFLLILAVATVTLPAFALLMEWRVASLAALLAVVLLAGYGLAVVSTFLAALVARAGHKSVLFVLVSFPLLIPLLLSAIAGTVSASEGETPWTALRVLFAYDGAASCGAYLLASAAWED
ncbi:MAG: heme exporter protein CcmB [Thermoanaerobaculia bacterium]